MSISPPPGYDRVVEDLAIEHRKAAALRALMAAGTDATPALRRGLLHDNPVVRARCCVVLDHFLDEECVPELMANLTHEHPAVRNWALHALACDRCKEGECRPAENDVVPIALRMLAEDPSRRVRVTAAHMLGPSVHRHPAVAAALEAARDDDVDPNVRKVAGWYAPGGSIFRRLTPKPLRVAR